jgi:hypothetical protein
VLSRQGLAPKLSPNFSHDCHAGSQRNLLRYTHHLRFVVFDLTANTLIRDIVTCSFVYKKDL